MINATDNKLSAPLINSRINTFSLMPVITPRRMEEPRKRADISVVHHFKNTTPAIMVKKVKI